MRRALQVGDVVMVNNRWGFEPLVGSVGEVVYLDVLSSPYPVIANLGNGWGLPFRRDEVTYLGDVR